MHSVTVYALGVAFISFVLYTFLQAVSKYNAKYNPRGLPGPTLVPWLGRVHDLPIDFMWLKFKEWGDMYGPIYRTKMLGSNFIIISDETIAEEMLIKKAKLYSDRPEIKSLFDAKSTYGSMEYLPLMGKNRKTVHYRSASHVANSCSEYWARQRKFTHSYLTGATNAQYYGIMELEAKRWLYRLVEDPDDFAFSLEDMCSKVMCQLTWDDDSLSVPLTPSAWGLLTQMSPAGPITNVLTPLWDYVPEPINPWKLRERKRHDEQQAWFMDCLQKTRRLMEKGKQRPCFTRTYLETAEKTSISGDYEASSVIGMMALVGIFTVAGPLYYFLVAMVHHPEWQIKCQEEIDQVCGSHPPAVADLPNLPILRACIKETMRWKPTVPTGVAHECEADDWFRGYFIPKGTRILPLDWAFLRNPVKYPDPDSYRPERWLESGWPTFQEPLTKYPDIVGMTSFGWGQRQCLGMSITRDETVTGCGGLMWAFNLKRKVHPVTGEEIEVPLEKSNSLLIIKPDPFEMAFEPRSATRKAEVIAQWKAAEAKDLEKRATFLRQAETREVLNGL
ncbi:cytochrome P450 [Cucurbitaria berberidis CBS 394.84]|uniref:Cytochrome P450 n=1 Tax=Cucurbitaria berberidis CBS 394.84 TaxID=1168544 RepID=A0A9P4GDX0_9PLEO|nr:cytochrome P450 [Cucurbitaria berberidis CBS 394.84]KAF1843536.1 cytochrome P450 [Cucurbitaria berberidis CBS 394.84]